MVTRRVYRIKPDYFYQNCLRTYCRITDFAPTIPYYISGFPVMLKCSTSLQITRTVVLCPIVTFRIIGAHLEAFSPFWISINKILDVNNRRRLILIII